MKTRILFAALGAALISTGCGAAAHGANRATLASADCSGLQDVDQQVAELYAPGNITRVEPLYRAEHRARSIQLKYVSGARIYVPAQRGMTDGYLERALSCHATQARGEHPNDPLKVAGLRDVDVRTVGTQVVIQMEGSNRESGKQILSRAQALQDPSTNVEVRQLSSLAQPDSM